MPNPYQSKDERDMIYMINILSAKSDIYEKILEHPPSTLPTKQLCLYGSSCFRRDPTHTDTYRHEGEIYGGLEALRALVELEKKRFLSHFDNFIRILTEKQQAQWDTAGEDTEPARAADKDLRTFIEKFTRTSLEEGEERGEVVPGEETYDKESYITHLFFLDARVASKLDFNTDRLKRITEFANDTLNSLQTGDGFVPLQTWAHDLAIVPLRSIVFDARQRQRRAEFKVFSKRRRNKRRDSHGGGGKRTKRKKNRRTNPLRTKSRKTNSPKKTMKVDGDALGWRPRVRENNINKLLLKSHKNGMTKLVITNFGEKDDVYIVNNEMKKRKLSNKKKRTVKKALRR
jgi:hypothetical protein